MGRLNKVTLMGQLGKEPRWGRLPSGELACSLVLGTEDEEQTASTRKRTLEWHRAVLAGKLAEEVRDRIAKGDQVYVEGKLKTRTWIDTKGITRFCTEIHADAVQVFPKTRIQAAPLTDPELVAWFAEYDEATAHQAAEKAAKAALLKQHREGRRPRRTFSQACH